MNINFYYVMTFSNVTERTFLNRPRTEFPFFLNSPFSSFRVLLDGRAVCFTTIIFFEKFLAYHYTIIVSPFQLFFLSLCFSLSLSISLSQSLSLSLSLSLPQSLLSLFFFHSLSLSHSLSFLLYLYPRLSSSFYSHQIFSLLIFFIYLNLHSFFYLIGCNFF